MIIKKKKVSNETIKKQYGLFTVKKKKETAGKFLLSADLMAKRQAIVLPGLKDPIRHQEDVVITN